jgi:hypothetical protein
MFRLFSLIIQNLNSKIKKNSSNSSLHVLHMQLGLHIVSHCKKEAYKGRVWAYLRGYLKYEGQGHLEGQCHDPDKPPH